jgi:signal transduction histidine kinase
VKKLRQLKFSIFLKLILIILLFGAVIDLSVFEVIKISTNTREPGPMRRAEKILISLIGNPPDTVKAKMFCQDMGWNMRFLSPGFKWASSDSVPTIEELSRNSGFTERYQSDDHFVYMYNSLPNIIYRTPTGTYILQLLNPHDVFDEQRAIVSLVIVMSLIILSFYFIVRRLFKPLKLLSVAVQEVGDGNYYIDIPVKRNDELGELAQSISSMASKIGDSIKAKERLLLDVSHELRTPLTRIKLGLEVDSPKEKIDEDINEMETMISGLLESYRSENKIEDLKLAKTDISVLISDTIEEYLSQERFKFLNPEMHEELIIDEEKIQTVLRNIINNALKYSAGEVEISIEGDLRYIRVIIKDRGVGISESDLPYIFEPFYRADHSRTRATGGFGLGLSICKKIMDAHNAKILVTSKPNAGTEFILVFNKQR